MRSSRVATLAMTLAIATAATGCGGDDGGGNGGGDGGGEGGDTAFADQSATDIAAAVEEDMGKLTSVKVTGDIVAEGNEVSLDMQLSENTCTGTISLGGTGTLEILGTEDGRWFKGDEAFWTSAGVPDLSLVLDKWVADQEDDFSEFCEVEELVSSLFDDDEGGEEKFEKVGTEDLDGEEAVVIEQDDSEDGLSTGYIRVEEPHYMMKIDKESGEDTGTVTFSEFDEEFEVTSPSEDEIVNLDDLG